MRFAVATAVSLTVLSSVSALFPLPSGLGQSGCSNQNGGSTWNFSPALIATAMVVRPMSCGNQGAKIDHILAALTSPNQKPTFPSPDLFLLSAQASLEPGYSSLLSRPFMVHLGEEFIWKRLFPHRIRNFPSSTISFHLYFLRANQPDFRSTHDSLDQLLHINNSMPDNIR
ncbi:hypothetical protein H4Q26_001991 [Puccinia striiformis f. sp. tritici PST-130]|nr:hypothetical protein H4Q26_001991 [Puccinia striiformis f. sp. tritici PST-130]